MSWADQAVLGALAGSAAYSLLQISVMLRRIAVALEKGR